MKQHHRLRATITTVGFLPFLLPRSASLRPVLLPTTQKNGQLI